MEFSVRVFKKTIFFQGKATLGSRVHCNFLILELADLKLYIAFVAY